MIEEKKYLPIGTICSLKANSKVFMITGYKGICYEQDEFVEYDYIGTIYPEGSLRVNNTKYFNHSDIATVIFLGYKNTSYELFNSRLLKEGNEPDEFQTLDSEESIPLETSSDINSKPSYAFDENGVVIIDNTASQTQANNYMFDENGVVINDVTTKNPFVNSYETVETKTEESVDNWDIFKKMSSTEHNVIDDER